MEVGISGLVIPAEWSLDETLTRIRADGYTALELALRDTGWFSLESTEEELRVVAESAKAAGVTLTSVCPALRSKPRDIMTSDCEIRKSSIETITECIRITSAVGVDTMLLVLGRLTPELYYDDAYANALAGMRELTPVAEELGVRLAIEYVWNKFLLSPMELARFLDEVDSPNAGFFFDSGNMVVFGYPEHWVRICGKHVMAVHLKDFRRQGYEWTPLLEGDVDFPAVMCELRKLGFDGALLSEVSQGTAPFADTAEAIRKIMRM